MPPAAVAHPPRCRSSTPGGRRATRGCATPPIRRRSRRSSPFMRHAGDGVHERRLRGLIVVLWRAGLRICEALALTEADLDPRRGSLLVRRGKGGRRREVGMETGRGSSSSHGSRRGSSCRSDRCASSSARRADGRGRPAPPARNCVASPARPGCVGALRRTSSGTPMPSRCPRRRAADRHPTPTRAHQPRHHLDQSAGHRRHRDHRHRPRPPRADGPRRQLAPALSPPPGAGKPRLARRRPSSRSSATHRVASDSQNAPFIAKQRRTRRTRCAPTAQRSAHAASYGPTPGGRKR
jgi:hypothetical protein